MDFEPFEQAGTIEIDYLGEPLNLESFGYFHLNLQEIINNVVIMLMESEGKSVRGVWPQQQQELIRNELIKAEIKEVEVGSLGEVISFAAYILAEPDVRAILQNLAANVVWAVGASGLPNIIRKTGQPSQQMSTTSKYKSPDIGKNLLNIMLAIAESNGVHDSQLTFRCNRSPSEEIIEVTLKVSGKHQQWNKYT